MPKKLIPNFFDYAPNLINENFKKELHIWSENHLISVAYIKQASIMMILSHIFD
jgi:hypothetical protein